MSEPQKTFSLGDEVQWSSQASGRTKEKRGKIVMVVEPGVLPVQQANALGGSLQFDASSSRYHESYIVAVKRGSNRKDYLYWPHVKKLSLSQEQKAA